MVQTVFRKQRLNPRLSFFADADITLPDGRLLRAQLSELSTRGCYIDTLEPIAVGTQLRLRISDGMRDCELKGKAIYVHSGGGMGIFGMGVVFGSMNSEQESAIGAWMRPPSLPGPQVR